MEDHRCKFWLPKKNRFCSNSQLSDSGFCGNHMPRCNGDWSPCPIDPSHSVLKENLEAHLKVCPLLKQKQSLSLQPFFQKGINAVDKVGDDHDVITSEMKRSAVYSLTVTDFNKLIEKIASLHDSLCNNIVDSTKFPEACNMWIKREIDSKLPFQEKHVKQQASIIGNLEDFGVLNGSCRNEESDGDILDPVPAVVEFGAGRGYLTQMLADCYGIKRVYLVERKSYKFKADRSLRQKENLILERLRIDIEDLNLNGVESLQGVPYLAIGKHLCGPATDLTLRCCLPKQSSEYKVDQFSGNASLKGLAIATCCHHLCQWKHYINKKFITELGITKEEFHAITWFTSWAVDADHGSDLSTDGILHLQSMEGEQCDQNANGVEGIVKNMKAVERAILGFMCKQIIDMGRMMWVKECGLDAALVKYVPAVISPENHLLIAKRP
ncbi:tRNA:m(4)X modification enzyme TRM13 [Mercurialis annua]|uniref:tRNA:m(4)X modification enzyme TRM13 n=1 Tax=Mercurialis annua TaxID=3986 RepID=UPI00215FFA2E|nr:tRNA:m(4)X modification enzyme TRM13 [Mercurialis annua]